MSRAPGFKLTDETKRKIGLANLGERNGMWKGDYVGYIQTARERAQRRYPLELCEQCGKKKALDRHHIDGNCCNNERSNILILCRACHMIIDGRMDKFHSYRKKHALPIL